jgi:mRNA-degrading endonuclease RelE of RelBE toxin-antitoxin system
VSEELSELLTGKPVAVLLAVEDLESLTQTLEILSDPDAMAAIAEDKAAAVWQFVSGPLLDNPHRVGKGLRYELEGYYSARRGQYRVIYRIDR